MIIDKEIAFTVQTYGKKLGKREKGELNEILQLCKRHSHACSEAVRLIPMHAMLIAVLLEQEKMLNAMERQIASRRMSETNSF